MVRRQNRIMGLNNATYQELKMSKKTVVASRQTFMVETSHCEIIPLKNFIDTVDEIKQKFQDVQGEHCVCIEVDTWENQVGLCITTYREETDAEYEQRMERMSEQRRVENKQFAHSLSTLVNLSDSEIDTMLATLNQIKISRT